MDEDNGLIAASGVADRNLAVAGFDQSVRSSHRAGTVRGACLATVRGQKIGFRPVMPVPELLQRGMEPAGINDHHADDHGGDGDVAPSPVVRQNLRQPHNDKGCNKRPPDRRQATQQQHRKGDGQKPEAEDVRGGNPQIRSVKAPRQGRENSRQAQRQKSRAGFRHAARYCVVLVVSQRLDRAADGRPLKLVKKEGRGRQQTQREVVVSQPVVGGQFVLADGETRQQHHAACPSRIRGLADHDLLQQLCRGYGHKNDVDPFQPQDRNRQKRGENHRQNRRDQERKPRIQPDHLGQDRIAVKPDGKEPQMSKVDDAAIAQ